MRLQTKKIEDPPSPTLLATGTVAARSTSSLIFLWLFGPLTVSRHTIVLARARSKIPSSFFLEHTDRIDQSFDPSLTVSGHTTVLTSASANYGAGNAQGWLHDTALNNLKRKAATKTSGHTLDSTEAALGSKGFGGILHWLYNQKAFVHSSTSAIHSYY